MLSDQSRMISIAVFMVFALVTFVITIWAARRNVTKSDFFAAGKSITGFQNGLAISGDYLSAAGFLGIVGLAFTIGYDALLYPIGGVAALAMMLFLFAEPMRRLGNYSVADICAHRLSARPVRLVSGIGALCVILLYVATQMVAAGALISLLFAVPYRLAIIAVGALMVVYVAFGGMLATTWVQIIKAVLLLIGALVLAIGLLQRFDFDISRMLASAIASHPNGASALRPGATLTSPLAALSLSLALLFGPLGMPHLLMRFFTVPNVREARQSVVYAGLFVGCFNILVMIIAVAGISILRQPALAIAGGPNMAALYLANIVGGSWFLGFMGAVSFATIIAVVAGLALAATATIMRDLIPALSDRVLSDSDELRISRRVPFFVGIVAVLLGIAFEGQNLAIMVMIAVSIAASVNFPILLLSIFWRGLTTRGAVIGGSIGLVSAVIWAALAKTIWVGVLGFGAPLVPFEYPTIVSLPLALGLMWLVSIFDTSPQAQQDRRRYDAMLIELTRP